jgi:alkylation response protein AidB-like acyl-CoA dehydrogenase
MDFGFTSEEQQYRARLRSWLEHNYRDIFLRDGEPPESVERMLYTRDDARWALLEEYHRRLYRAGYAALHWPKEWGGAGATLVEQAIYQEEVLRLGLPLFGANPLAIDRVGPTLILMGTERQKSRFLPKMLTGEEFWCQGYSEPNAGSDLASLTTRAVLDGDSFVINGQKVWTSLANRAHWQVLLVRTDPAAEKHKGLSYLLVDMRSPGIEVRPLRQITGEAGFNEVFYDNVRVPVENLVGQLNHGWEVSIATMMYQRTSAGTRQPIERTVDSLIALTREIEFCGVRACEHPYVRQRIAEFATEAQCLRLSRYRTLTRNLKGKAPGPEGSFAKLASSELNLRVVMFANELLGPWGAVDDGKGGTAARWLHGLLDAREHTIAGGTNQIQHNIIGERVLRLPKG